MTRMEKSKSTRIFSTFFLLIKFYSMMKSECKEHTVLNGNAKSGLEGGGIKNPFAALNNFLNPNPTLISPLQQQQQQRIFYPLAYTTATYHQPTAPAAAATAVEANNYYPYVNVENVNSQQYVAGVDGQISNQQQETQSGNPEYSSYYNVIAESPSPPPPAATAWTPQTEPPPPPPPPNNLQQNEPSQHFLVAANNRDPFLHTEAIFGNSAKLNNNDYKVEVEEEEEEEEKDACSAVSCKENSICVARPMPPPPPIPQHCVEGSDVSCPRPVREAVCVDRCETVRCSKGDVCRTLVGPCGNSFCEPSAVCWNPCEDVICNGKSITSGGSNCTSLTVPYCSSSSSSSSSYCGTVPICGRDPCEQKVCPRGRGCYPQVQSCALNGPCEVEAVCRDPCFGVRCAVGEYCRIDERPRCVKAPCNPIPVCVNPCDSVHCPQGQRCRVLQQPQCIKVAAGPCYPVGVCEADEFEK